MWWTPLASPCHTAILPEDAGRTGAMKCPSRQAGFQCLLLMLEHFIDSTTWLEVLANANYAANYQVYLIAKSLCDFIMVDNNA